MATLVGSSVGVPALPMYPDKPGLKAWMETPDPNGYTSQMGQFGTRAGTILPHHSARTSFEQLRKQKHNVPTSVVSIQNPTQENPMGGMQVLIPAFDMNGVTSDMMSRAKETAKTMTNDPVEQDVLMFKLLAEEMNGGKAAAAVMEQPMPAPEPVYQAPPATPAPAVAPPMLPNGGQITPEQLAAALPYLLRQLQNPQAATPVMVPRPAEPQQAPPTPVYVPTPVAAGPVMSTAANPFMSLGIPDLDLQPARPRAQVNFKLGKFGGQSAYYHWVLQEKNALYLVFDTRYDYPVYLPPNLGPDEVVEVELVNLQGQVIGQLACCLCGMGFRFGVFQFLVLLIPAGA